MPSTRPRTSWAPSADLSQIPACRALSRSVSRRIRAIPSARAISTTERVLAQATDLRAIGAFCIGTNQIDLRAAAQRGVAVFNAPFSNTRSVVEIALAEVIALMRRLTDRDRALHAGIW